MDACVFSAGLGLINIGKGYKQRRLSSLCIQRIKSSAITVAWCCILSLFNGRTARAQDLGVVTSGLCFLFGLLQEEGPQVKRSSSPPHGAPKKRTAFIDITNVRPVVFKARESEEVKHWIQIWTKLLYTNNSISWPLFSNGRPLIFNSGPVRLRCSCCSAHILLVLWTACTRF